MGGTPRPQTITTETQGTANKGACELSRTMDLQPQGGPPILVNESSLLKIRMLAEREPVKGSSLPLTLFRNLQKQ